MSYRFSLPAAALLVSLAGAALADSAPLKAPNLEWAKIGEVVIVKDPALAKHKIGDKFKLVDAKNAKITGEGEISTAVVQQQKDGTKVWEGWSIKVTSIKK